MTFWPTPYFYQEIFCQREKMLFKHFKNTDMSSLLRAKFFLMIYLPYVNLWSICGSLIKRKGTQSFTYEWWNCKCKCSMKSWGGPYLPANGHQDVFHSFHSQMLEKCNLRLTNKGLKPSKWLLWRYCSSSSIREPQ